MAATALLQAGVVCHAGTAEAVAAAPCRSGGQRVVLNVGGDSFAGQGLTNAVPAVANRRRRICAVVSEVTATTMSSSTQTKVALVRIGTRGR